jgi:hypothetical protein
MSQHLQWNFYKKTGLIHIWWCFYNFTVLFYREEIYGNERAEGGSQPPLMIVFYKKYTNIDPGWHIRYLGNTDLHCFHIYTGLWVMVFNTTFNNISVISWRSVLLVEETTFLHAVNSLIAVYIWGQSWLYGSWISNYLCNQCLSPLKLWVQPSLRRGVLDTALCDKVCQWLAAGR